MTILPINLTGETLGERHKHLNSLVYDALKNGVNFKELQSIHDCSPVDRLFKVGLASQLRDVDYLMKMLKDDDMLYVSRALKCKWLLEDEYQNIINAEYLEQHLYPQMIKTAVNKMKCWLSINLKDPERCQQFYEYYFNSNFDLAIRFLTHCTVSCILNEMPKIIDKLSPFYFKVLCEKTPQIAKIFFDSLSTNEKVVNLYLKNDVDYFNNLIVILKSDSEIFLDITEKCFVEHEFKRLSSTATKFIMRNCKDRFTKKTELYTAWLLDVKTIANCLTAEECKDVVVKLARAQYLDYWFSYQEVEPFIKRLKEVERATFKDKIFVKKDIGVRTKEWLYPKPSKPQNSKTFSIFNDDDKSIICLDDLDDLDLIECSLQLQHADMVFQSHMIKPRTALDRLFDEYRFFSFEKTFVDISKKIVVESSPQIRQYMLLVLVSKTGGRIDSIYALLEFLAKHANEPSHVRSTIVRSFVKRASVWRVPQECWKLFLEFAVELGLDGKPADAECREGLHAVVLRSLLETGSMKPEIFSVYIKEFSTLQEYSLSFSERKIVGNVLPELLLRAIINETDSNKQVEMFDFLFKTIKEYNISLDIGLIVPPLAGLVKQDPEVGKRLILELFEDKKARKELFLENFMFVSTDASYVNALRHNIDVLKMDQYIKRALENNARKEQFFRKLAVYFTEVHGLAETYSTAVKKSILSGSNLNMARYLALLADSKSLKGYLKNLNKGSEIITKRLAAALTANSHLSRPKLNIDAIGWHEVGTKAIANHTIICRKVDLRRHLTNLIKSPGTVKLAIVLSQGTDLEVDTYKAVSKMRPNIALKCAVKHIHRDPNSFNTAVWEIVKPILRKFNFENKSNTNFSKSLRKLKKIPLNIRAEYCLTLLAAIKKNPQDKAIRIVSCLEKLAHTVNSECIEDILQGFVEYEFTMDNVLNYDNEKQREIGIYLKIIIKFVLLSKTEETQLKRLKSFLEPILPILKGIWDSSRDQRLFSTYMDNIFETLRFRKVFYNEDYVSCMPVFERIVSWMHDLLPIENYFLVYTDIHLTMLYFKSVRQCIKKRPDIFKCEITKIKEGIDILGRMFGHYIAKDVDKLKSTYFDSIVELYSKKLSSYLINLVFWDPLKDEILAAVIKGIIYSGTNSTQLLGVYLFKENLGHNVNKEINKDMHNILTNIGSAEIQYLLI